MKALLLEMRHVMGLFVVASTLSHVLYPLVSLEGLPACLISRYV